MLVVLRTRDLGVLKVNQLPDAKSIGAFHWTGPDRSMFTAVRKVDDYATSASTGEWYPVNEDGTVPRPLIVCGTRDAAERGKAVTNEQFSLLDALRDDDINVAMSTYTPRPAEGAGTKVVLLATYTSRQKSLVRVPEEDCSGENHLRLKRKC